MAASNLPLNDFLRQYQITQWDFLLICDGSGHAAQPARPIGAACAVIERDPKHRELVGSTWSHGNNFHAELLAVMQGLFWVDYYRMPDYAKVGRRIADIHIFSDNQAVVKRLEAEFPQDNSDVLTAAILYQNSRGLLLHPHFLERNTIALHELVDVVSRDERQTRDAIASELLQTKFSTDLEVLNP